MVRQAPWRNQYHIDPHIFRTLGIARIQQVSRRSDPSQARMVDGKRQIAVLFACFHFDKGQRFAAPCNQIDLAARGFDALSDNVPALQPQPPRRDILATSPPFFGIFAVCFQAPPFLNTVSPEPVEPEATARGQRRFSTLIGVLRQAQH